MILYFEKQVEAMIEGIYQWNTYGGLLEGLPTKRMNRRIIKETIEEAKKICYQDNYHLIKPVEKPIEYDRKYIFGKPYALPPIVCVASLSCLEPQRDESKDGSSSSCFFGIVDCRAFGSQ